MVKYHMGRSGRKKPDPWGIISRWGRRLSVAGAVSEGGRVETVQAEVLVRWVPVHFWWRDLRGHPALGSVQDPGVVQGLAAAVRLQLIMVDNFDFGPRALLVR